MKQLSRDVNVTIRVFYLLQFEECVNKVRQRKLRHFIPPFPSEISLCEKAFRWRNVRCSMLILVLSTEGKTRIKMRLVVIVHGSERNTFCKEGIKLTIKSLDWLSCPTHRAWSIGVIVFASVFGVAVIIAFICVSMERWKPEWSYLSRLLRRVTVMQVLIEDVEKGLIKCSYWT